VLGNATITAFLATTDAPRAKRFYETVLGLRIRSDDEFALAFDCDGIELRIQKVREFRPHPFTALGWRVHNVRTTMLTLVNGGVTFERYDFLESGRLGGMAGAEWRPGGVVQGSGRESLVAHRNRRSMTGLLLLFAPEPQ